MAISSVFPFFYQSINCFIALFSIKRLKLYPAQLNGKYIKVGEEAVIETETQIQTCTCQEASRTSCIIEAKPVTKTVEQDQVKTQEIDA